ncbi:MAG: DUF2922 domain-containing protein [Clostridium sp.]
MELILTMVFVGQTGEKSSFSVSGIKQDITEAEVATLMNLIIAKNIFMTKNGDLVSKVGASLTEKVVTKLDVA